MKLHMEYVAVGLELSACVCRALGAHRSWLALCARARRVGGRPVGVVCGVHDALFVHEQMHLNLQLHSDLLWRHLQLQAQGGDLSEPELDAGVSGVCVSPNV